MAILRFSTYYAMGMNYWKEKLFDWSIDMLFALLLSNILLQVLKGDQGSLWNGGQIFWKKKCSVDESEWYLSNTLHARVDKNINECKRFELKRSLRYYLIFKIWNSMEYK